MALLSILRWAEEEFAEEEVEEVVEEVKVLLTAIHSCSRRASKSLCNSSSSSSLVEFWLKSCSSLKMSLLHTSSSSSSSSSLSSCCCTASSQQCFASERKMRERMKNKEIYLNFLPVLRPRQGDTLDDLPGPHTDKQAFAISYAYMFWSVGGSRVTPADTGITC